MAPALKSGVPSAFLASKDPTLAEPGDPVNILTRVDKADRYIDKQFGKTTGYLRYGYDWLSEYAHPNFVSNCLAFTLDEPNCQFVLRHGGDLQEQDFQLSVYLEISAKLFVALFDDFGRKVADAGLAE